MTRVGLGWIALLALACVACVKRVEQPRADEPTAVAAVLVLDQEDSVVVLPAPTALAEGVRALLGGRNLVMAEAPLARWAESFAERRSTRQRVLALLQESEQDIVLLIETRARFGSLMEGRYRWTVPAQLTLARRGGEDFPVQASVEVPVFLRYPHQGGAEAVTAAAPAILRRLGRLLDELLVTEVLPGASWAPSVPAESDAIYFVMVDRHRNGDPSNDLGVDRADPQAFHGGDLAGVRADLDRIAAMGFRSVWLTPVWETRDATIGVWGAFHGYWTQDPRRVEPRFGTEAELRGLSDDLRGRGMGLILDVVTNHLAPGSPLLSTHPGWVHGQGDIVDWGNAEEALTHDVHGLPDLAQERPEVARFLIDSGRRWVEELHPEGLRLDAVRHVPPAFFAEHNAAMREVGGADLALIGELFDGGAAAVDAAWRGGRFSGMFDFPLHYALTETLCGDAPLGRLASVLGQDHRYPDAGELVTFLDNHDLPRIASVCAESELTPALVALLSLRGRPVITWGTEAGLAGAQEPENRADFPWSGPRPLEATLTELLAARRAQAALRAPDAEVLWLGERQLILAQRAEGQTALLLINRDPGALRWEPPPAGWRDAVTGRAAPGPWSIAPGEVRAFVASDGAPPAERAQVDLRLDVSGAPLGVGDRLVLVGAGSALGDWSPTDGVVGDAQHRLHADVRAGTVLEFKLVVRSAAGPDRWEQRANRYLLVEERAPVVPLQWEA